MPTYTIMIKLVKSFKRLAARSQQLESQSSQFLTRNTKLCLSILIIFLIQLLPIFAVAQTSKGPMNFPELEFTKIDGAPVLNKPVLVTGTKKHVFVQGHGLAAPAYYDWDGDGLKDLLVGEFGSGVQDGKYMGNFVRVFKNVGTEESPEFTGQFNYARPPFEILSNGTPYSVDQYCCIGFTPQFIDLNNDGQSDMVSGQYFGEVSWFEWSPRGFLPGKELPQMPPATGHPRTNDGMGLGSSKEHQYYWLYSSASFGDLTNDGKLDMIVGGRELRISRNIGTVSEPQFAQRQSLLDIQGNPLKVHEYTHEELKSYERLAEFGYKPSVSGGEKLSPYVVDWDQDGTLDLLVTNEYGRGYSAVDFFKGVQTKDGHRFQPAVPLFTVKGDANVKALPGIAPRVSVADWNNDGVNDLLIGIGVATVKSEFSDQLSWNWEKDTGIGKDDPAFVIQIFSESELQRYKEETKIPQGITWEEYITIRHQGYVYVMLGGKEEGKLAKTEKSTKTKKK
jgi:hypothetical protein